MVYKFGITVARVRVQIQRHQTPGKLLQQQVTPRALRAPTPPLVLPLLRVNSWDENKVSAILPTVDLEKQAGKPKTKVVHPPALLLGPHRQSCGCSGKLVSLSLWTGRSPACGDIPPDRKPEDIPRDNTHGDDPPGAIAGGVTLRPRQPDMSQEGAGAAKHPSAQPNSVTIPASGHRRSERTCEGISTKAYGFAAPARRRATTGTAGHSPGPRPARSPPRLRSPAGIAAHQLPGRGPRGPGQGGMRRPLRPSRRSPGGPSAPDQARGPQGRPAHQGRGGRPGPARLAGPGRAWRGAAAVDRLSTYL